MKTIKKTLLHFQQGTSNKVYHVYLVEVATEAYLVNFEYGRYGSTLREGTKTSSPVTLEKAQKLYNSLVVSKVNKSYKIQSGYNPLTQEEKSERKSIRPDEYALQLIKRLKRASEERLRKVDNYSVSRLIYQAGTLKLEEAKPYIVTLYATSSEEENAFYYAVAWALGRYRDGALRRTLESLREKLNEASRYVVDEALFLLREEVDVVEIKGLTLPLPFGISLKNEHLDNFLIQVKLLDEMIETTYRRYKNIDSWCEEERREAKGELTPLLEQADELFLKLYIQASVEPQKHQAILKAMPSLPINEFNFSLFRRLYKMAEMRDDHAMLGQLITKIESKKMACYEIYEWNRDNRRSLGCSRLYFKKRSLRYLTGLAMHDEQGYLALAKEILLSLDNYPTAFEPFTTEYYDEDWNLKRKKYDAFAVHLTFVYILYGAGKRYMMAPSRKVWEVANQSISGEHRPEMHREIWNRYPEVALEILAKSSIVEVQTFAFGVVEEHPEVIKKASLQQLLPLLNLHLDGARGFFFELLKSRYVEQGEEEIVEAMLLSSDDNIAHYALECIAGNRKILWRKGLVVEVLFGSSKYLFNRLLPLLSELESPKPIVDELVERLISTPLPLEGKIKERMVEALRALSKGVEVSHLEQMMEAEVLSDIHLLAATLIRDGAFHELVLPLELKEKIASYDDPSMLATTIYLLGRLSDEELMKEYQMLVAFLYHNEEQVSLEAMKIVLLLAKSEEGRAKLLLQEMVKHAFTATKENIADNVVEVVRGLEEVYVTIGVDQLYRLLTAKSKLAVRLGNLLLQQQGAEQFSVVQWANLAKNPNKSVRIWAYDAYMNYPEMVRKAMPKSLMIFDSDWEETRIFAMGYFESFEPLSSDNMVVIADSNYSDVQQFAKKIIMERGYDRASLMLKLAQHPALTIQKFVTDLMLSGVTIQELLSLERFFNTLLHSVNKNRVAKTRVLELLYAQLSHREVAEMVARLATHHSASMVWADKSLYVEAMSKISDAYPDIELPLTIEPLAMKEVSHGV